MKTKSYFQIIFILIAGLFACRPSSNNNIGHEINRNGDMTFIDTVNLNAYLLYDDRYILKISMGDEHGKKYPATRFGFYHKNGDTIFTNCLDFASDEYKKIKTKYFWIEMYSGRINNGYGEFVPADSLYRQELFKDPVLIADSLFGTKFFGSNFLSDSTLLVSVPFCSDTLFIKGNRIVDVTQK